MPFNVKINFFRNYLYKCKTKNITIVKQFSFLLVLTIVLSQCKNPGRMASNDNPFLNPYGTPYEVPVFGEIQNKHYMPAFEAGMKTQKEEIQAIIDNKGEPGFKNTIVALNNSGEQLRKVSNVFYNLLSAETNEELQEIAKEVAPMLSAHRDDIKLDPALFDRVRKIYDKREKLDLDAGQDKLLDKTYKEFVRGGALLGEEDQARLREINSRLSVLSLTFGDNVLDETNKFQLIIENEEELSGLPEGVVKSAAEAARNAGLEGKWLFTLHKPSMIPFLQYSDIRPLREKILTAYINRGNNDNENDNKAIVREMVNLRIEKAGLLGYPTHAHYVLEENMAKQPGQVYDLIDKIWEAALPVSREEADKLEAMLQEDHPGTGLQPWDWWYYAGKLRKEKYDLDEEVLRPYFKLENVRDGIFELCDKLWGLQFKPREELPKYHPDVQVFEVMESDGRHIGILFMDFFPRPGKRGGAWMNSYRKQYRMNGEEVTPVITNVLNFSKPTGNKPALLSFDEVRTMFHEFGHGLHGLLSDCRYRELSGTSVARDFVELPSQIMENWAAEPEVMKSYARHYESGEAIPDELIEKIKASAHFNQGFATVEYLSAAFLDMDWHTQEEQKEWDVNEFERKALEKINLIPEIVVRYRSTYFNHIFSGGYSSGYYSYIWAEVLDADAFQAFKESSLFDRETARSFRENILGKGGSEDPMTLYKRFRGREPDPGPMLRRKGLL